MQKINKIHIYIFLFLVMVFIFCAIFYILSIYNSDKSQQVEADMATCPKVNYSQTGKYELASYLIDEKCAEDFSNVYRTECTIELLDRSAAEREWKQRKLESIKHPQINTFNMINILEEEQAKIINWHEGFEKMRDAWCVAQGSFATGSGIPLDIAWCQLEFELRAIDDLNFIYYKRILEDTAPCDGIPDFEPTKSDIDLLVKTNTTTRGCIWAGEEVCD